MNLKELVDNLILTLEKENQIYLEVLELSKNKKKVIIDSKIKELEKITEKEKSFVVTLIKIEEARDKIVNEILKKLGILEIENVSDLLKYLDGEQKNSLTFAKNNLMKTIRDVSEQNDFNKKLLEQSLELIEFNIDVLTTRGDSGLNYSKDARDEEKEKRSMFDIKV